MKIIEIFGKDNIWKIIDNFSELRRDMNLQFQNRKKTNEF